MKGRYYIVLYIKRHPEVLQDSILTESTETDIKDISYEIDLECAQLSFETTHSMIEEYVAEMSEDSFKDAKNNADSGNVEDAEFKEVKTDKPEGKASEANKTIWQKIKAFINKIITKVKELFTRFVNWITTKIMSNDKFIAQFKGQKLGKIKAEAYDYDHGFDNIKNAYATAKKAFDVTKKAFDEIMNTGSHTDNDELKKVLDDAKENVDRIMGISGAQTFSEGKKASEEYHKGYMAGYKEALIGKKVERTLDGNVLLNILSKNKDIKNSLQKVTVGFMESFKYAMKVAENATAHDAPTETRILINYSVNLNARCIQTIISAAQELIVGIRGHINKCANVNDEPEVVK